MLDAVLGFLGAERANQSRERIAEQANEFSAQQYATRYQTTVKDLTAAGLNPMLAYSQGAGSAPSGQQAQGIENSMSSAIEAHQKGTQRDLMRQQIEQSKAQISNTQADTVLKQAQAVQAEEQTRLTSAQRAKTEEDERVARGNANLAAVDLVRRGKVQETGIQSQEALAKLYFSQIQVNKANLPKIASEIVLNGANSGLASARARQAIAEGDITIQDFQRALNDARYERATGGVIRQTSRDLGAIMGARNQRAQGDRADRNQGVRR